MCCYNDIQGWKCVIDNRFGLKFSKSDKLTKMMFSHHFNNLPKKWRILGLSFKGGQTPEEIEKIIKNEEGVENIITESFVPRLGSGARIYIFNFDIGKKYSVSIWSEQNLGVTSLNIQEYDPDEY